MKKTEQRSRNKDYAIGIDLGGTTIKATAVRHTGASLAQIQLDFQSAKKMDWAKKIRKLIQRIQKELANPATWVGLCAPGLASLNGNTIAHMPGRLQGLEGLNWTKYLDADRPVPVLNDAHAALLGEAWLGGARSFRNVVMLTLGTGVGGAAMVEGKLLRGNIGRAGHLGHASLDPDGPPDCAGTPGSLEVAIGNCTIQERTGGRFQTTHDLIAAHLKGDAGATAVWLKSVKALAAAICSFINILDPEAVIIGGGISRAEDALFKPLQQFLDPMEWRPGGQRVKILPAKLGEFAGAIGAAGHAMRQNGVKTEIGEWRVDLVPYVHRV